MLILVRPTQADTQAQLQAQNDQQAQLQAQNAELQTRLSTLESEKAALETRLKDQEDLCKTLEDRLKTQEAEHVKVVKTLEETIAKLRAEKDAIEAARAVSSLSRTSSVELA
jgi:predicted nuclease with TOPRIM domain